MSSNPDQFVSFTARLMAAIRAEETNRTDALFTDPFAAQLAGSEAIAVMHQRLTAADLAYVAVRTRFFDEFLLAAARTIDQVVLLAAGMDTRAFRLNWSAETRVYELDQPGVLETKAALLPNVLPRCQRYALSADLTQPWSHLLLEQGYQADLPSVWLLEGLLMYLTASEVHGLLQTVASLTAPGSQLGLDLVNELAVDYAPYKGYFKSGFDQPERLLAESGWDAIVLQPGDEPANYNRYPQRFPDRNVAGIQRAFLVTARRQG